MRFSSLKYLLTPFFIALISLSMLFVYTGNVMADDPTPTCPPAPSAPAGATSPPCIQVFQGQGGLNFRIPSLSDVLTFAIRAFFIIGGLAALIFLLLGALAWITSGGDKENVSKAQQKITNAIIGVILIAVVLAVVVTLEQVVFAGKIGLGLSVPITIPGLIK